MNGDFIILVLRGLLRNPVKGPKSSARTYIEVSVFLSLSDYPLHTQLQMRELRLRGCLPVTAAKGRWSWFYGTSCPVGLGLLPEFGRFKNLEHEVSVLKLSLFRGSGTLKPKHSRYLGIKKQCQLGTDGSRL
jgi:hypothetical protein